MVHVFVMAHSRFEGVPLLHFSRVDRDKVERVHNRGGRTGGKRRLIPFSPVRPLLTPRDLLTSFLSVMDKVKQVIEISQQLVLAQSRSKHNFETLVFLPLWRWSV